MPALPSTGEENVFAAKRHFGVLFVFALILLVVSVSAGFYFYKIRATQKAKVEFLEEFKKSTAKVDFGAALRNTRYQSNFEISATAEARVNKFAPLYENFGYLRSNYLSSHDAFLRTKALELAGYLKNTYPAEVAKYKLEIECLDASCVSAQYPQEVQEVLKLIDQAKFPQDSDYQGFVKRSLESAVIKSDRAEKFNNYFSAFQYLWLAYQKKQDANVRLAGEKLLDFIKAGYPKELENLKAVQDESRFIFK